MLSKLCKFCVILALGHVVAFALHLCYEQMADVRLSATLMNCYNVKKKKKKKRVT